MDNQRERELVDTIVDQDRVIDQCSIEYGQLLGVIKRYRVLVLLLVMLVGFKCYE